MPRLAIRALDRVHRDAILDVPGVDGHALEELLSGVTVDHVVPNMVLGRDLLDAWNELVQPGVRGDVVQRGVDALANVRVGFSLVYDLVEPRDIVLFARVYIGVSSMGGLLLDVEANSPGVLSGWTVSTGLSIAEAGRWDMVGRRRWWWLWFKRGVRLIH